MKSTEERYAMTTERKSTVARRAFLRGLGLGAVAGAAATSPLVTEARADTETYDEKRKTRYRVTADVKNFYRVCRYPSAGR
jgi:hypothetical protein